MKRTISLCLWLSLLFITSVKGQTVSEIKEDKAQYIWGEGKGNTLKKADDRALSDLINQISVSVESKFQMLIDEDSKEGYKETVDGVIKTYSSATLNNTERIVLENEPDAHVFRYIKRSEIDKIFAARRQKILEYADAAGVAEKKRQIADALRYYYWALTLLRSMPDPSEVKFKDKEGQERQLSAWLPLKINTIFSDMNISVKRIKKEDSWQNVELAITYQDQPVRNFDYTYWDGRDWSNLVSAKDGRGIAELPEMANASEIRVKGEYVFEGEATLDMELRDVMQKIDEVPFRSCYLKAEASENTITGKDGGFTLTLQSNEPKTTNSMAVATPSMNQLFSPVTDDNRYIETVKKIEEAIRNRQYESVKEYFDATGYDMYTKLINYGRAKVYGTPSYSVLRSGETVICRSLPLVFSFKTNTRTFVEDVIFEFNADGKITSLSFGLADEATKDIAAKSFWSEAARVTLIRFLENYKTAYALKRIDYIESIFADNAVIITGSVLKQPENTDVKTVLLSNKQAVKYTRQTKEEYIKRLRACFASNEFINLRFADNDIRKSGKGEIYGIQIKQDYFSSNYGDTGYLFLLVDLNESEKPTIYVRAWQPEKDPEFGFIDLSHFTF